MCVCDGESGVLLAINTRLYLFKTLMMFFFNTSQLNLGGQVLREIKQIFRLYIYIFYTFRNSSFLEIIIIDFVLN